FRFPRLKIVLWLFVACFAFAGTARGGDDTARFYGTWQAIFPFNGQMITMRSMHDESGYTNSIATNTAEQPAANGTFQAANGKYTTSAPYPNNAGVYHFIGNDTVVCVNAAGQTVTWKRYKAPGAVNPSPASNPPPKTPRADVSPEPSGPAAPPAAPVENAAL